jgi:hypothetical protein
MPMTLNLPPDFRPAAEALRAHPKDPLAQEFLEQLRLDARWSPRLPRGLLWVARRLGSPMHGTEFLKVTLTGFRSRRLRHVGSALLAIARAGRKRGEYIYDDGRDLLIIGGDDAPSVSARPTGSGGRKTSIRRSIPASLRWCSPPSPPHHRHRRRHDRQQDRRRRVSSRDDHKENHSQPER